MNEVEFLQKERKSFIIGSLVVLGVCFFAQVLLLGMMLGPQLRTHPEFHSLSEMMAWQQKLLSHLDASSQWELALLSFAGALGLFFLNWRFSALLRRPRSAFAKPGFSWARLGWNFVLFVASMFYTRLIPELLVIAVLAHWGTDEIRRRAAHSGPNAPDSNS